MKFLMPCLFLVSCNTPYSEPMGDDIDIPVASFEACLVKGGDIMESYPRQCSLDGQSFTEQIGQGKIGDKRILYLEVGPQKTDCVGVGPMECLYVNGQLFYDHIQGFTHKPGVTSVLEVVRTQYCDPDVMDSCPQDAGIYNYQLVKVIKAR